MHRQAALQRISRVVQKPLEAVLEWKERTGGKVMGCLSCMPFFAPEELVHAAGMLPVGIWGAEIPVSRADAKIQSFACSMARTSLEMGLSGMLGVCDGFLFPSTCDAFQNLSEIWRASMDAPCFEVVFPKQVSRPSAVSFLLHQLTSLQRDLEAFSGVTISPQALRRSCRLYNENRTQMRGLDHLRAKDVSLVTARQMAELVLASSYLPREEHTSLTRSLLPGAGQKETEIGVARKPESDRVRLLLSGVMPRPLAILPVLESAGAWIVGDDLGLGSLYYSLDIPDQGDPLADLAQAYLHYPLCSTVHRDAGERSESLLARARKAEAAGVVLFALKFCEPEFFDYPQVKERLESEGVPVLLLETELGTAETGSVRTRVEAFVESLRARTCDTARARS